MKALCWHGKRNVRVDSVPIPAVTEATDVVCKVTGLSVCGSDLHLYKKDIKELQNGDILGHEWMGIVDEVGPAVKKFKKGDRVVASFHIACGECKFCKDGLSSMCDMTNTSKVQENLYGQAFAGIFGYSHFTGGFAGGQAEYVRCPIADFNLLKVPDSLSDEKALYLSDIVPTSYHTVRCAEIGKGSSVAIWGLGPIGLLAAQWCRIKGARRIIGIDCVPERLTFAKQKFGCETIDFSKDSNVVDAILAKEVSGVDCAIDAAGFSYTKTFNHSMQRAIGLETDSPEALNEAIKAVRKFGTIAIVADYFATANGFLIGAVMEKGITLRGTGQSPVQQYWPELLAKVESGEFDPTIILTHRFALEELPQLYEAFDRKEYGILKSFVQTKFSSDPSKGMPVLSRFNSASFSGEE
ncbi:chaperonin 10-like protein [Zopfochytrium polystomum]|nr:chaperonin 10-like protein [Zopfochytrium polystomum]